MTNLYGYLVKHFWQNVMNRPLRTKLLLLVSLKACIFSLILSLSFLANGHEWQGFCTLIISLIYGAHFSIILSDHSPAFFSTAMISSWVWLALKQDSSVS